MADTVEWLRLLFNLAVAVLSMALMIYAFRSMRKLDRERDAALAAMKDFEQNGPNPEMIKRAGDRLQAEILERMGLDLDLLTRVETDLAFLHSQVYDSYSPGVDHSGCPICETTVPELEAVIERLRSMRVTIETRGLGQ